jgi:protein O-mannosyl-transferase
LIKQKRRGRSLNRLNNLDFFKKNNYFIWPFLLCICIILYFNALSNDFIFDDNYVIVNNPYIKNLSLAPLLFKTDIFYFQHPGSPALGEYYRPLQALSHSLDYLLWGLKPYGYRMTNILIHSTNAYLLYLLIYLLFKNNLLALLSAIFFSIHPIQVSDVAFISTRSVPLEMLFMLLSIFTFIKYFLNQKKIDYFLSLFFYVLAFLSHETALLLPLFIILCSLFLNFDRRKLLIRLLPFGLIFFIYLALRSYFIPTAKLNPLAVLSISNLKAFFYYLWLYCRQLILPVSSAKLIFGNSGVCRLALSLAAWGMFVTVLIRSLILRNKIAIFGAVFYFIGLIPVINLSDTIAFFGPLNSEHYVYIASAGFFLLVSSLVIDIGLYFKRIIFVLLVFIIAAYSSLTIVSSTIYGNSIVFYNYLLDIGQKGSFIHINLGNAYYEKGMYDKAIEQARLALEKEPSGWDIYLLMGNIYMTKGDLSRAIEMYNKTLILNPGSYEAYNNLGLIAWRQGKIEAAAMNFKKAADLSPGVAGPLHNLDYMLKTQEAKVKK